MAVKNKTDKKWETNNKMPRRDFFKTIWALLGIAAGVEILYMIYDFTVSPGKDKKENKDRFIDVGAEDDFSPGSISSFRKNSFYLSRLEDGSFLALSIKCTHLGCAVTWEADKKEFLCPCHSSRFDSAGRVRQSPATRPLDVYPVIIEEGMVKVNLGKTIRRNNNEIFAEKVDHHEHLENNRFYRHGHHCLIFSPGRRQAS